MWRKPFFWIFQKKMKLVIMVIIWCVYAFSGQTMVEHCKTVPTTFTFSFSKTMGRAFLAFNLFVCACFFILLSDASFCAVCVLFFYLSYWNSLLLIFHSVWTVSFSVWCAMMYVLSLHCYQYMITRFWFLSKTSINFEPTGWKLNGLWISSEFGWTLIMSDVCECVVVCVLSVFLLICCWFHLSPFEIW